MDTDGYWQLLTEGSGQSLGMEEFLGCTDLISSLLIPDDFRIFCGDLGNEVNDDILARAFSRFPSFLKAKVIRDKRTGKTKGYGFVSFKDPSDYVRAMREMNGE